VLFSSPGSTCEVVQGPPFTREAEHSEDFLRRLKNEKSDPTMCYWCCCGLLVEPKDELFVFLWYPGWAREAAKGFHSHEKPSTPRPAWREWIRTSSSPLLHSLSSGVSSLVILYPRNI
jgi:hypothetical protein